MSLINTTFKELMAEHNAIVKDMYKVTDVGTFENYITQEVTVDGIDAYIEISSNETLTGSPYILEFEMKRSKFR